MSVQHGHSKTTTFIAGGIVAPFVIDRPVNREIFETWVQKVLVPDLSAGDIVVMDDLASHKGPRVRAIIIEAAGEVSVFCHLLTSRKRPWQQRLRRSRPYRPWSFFSGPAGPPPDRRVPRHLVFHLGVELGADQYDQSREPNPCHEADHRAERAVGLIVAPEIGDVPRERHGADYPGDRCERAPPCDPPPLRMLAARSVAIDQREKQRDRAE